MTDLPDSTRWQLWIVAFGFFMQSLDTTIVNTALPSMAQSLGESPLHMHMVIVSYVLTVAVMLPASGWLLLGLFGSQHVSVDSGTTQTVFMYTWLSMAFIIALPAFIFARVPNDTHQNVAISRRKRSAQ